jgi:hypothetical protein
MSGGVAAAIASVLVSGVASVALIYIASEKLGSGMASLLQACALLGCFARIGHRSHSLFSP